MAVDGRKLGNMLSNRDEHSCIPCARDGSKVAAIKYCVECDENLCSTCLSHHNRFPVMRGHQTSDTLSSQTGKKIQDLPKQICDKHGGKLVDLYCSNHDSVGCSECVELDHSSCQGIKYISCVAKGIEIQKEITNLEIKLDEFLTQLDKHKQHKQDRLKNFQQEKARLLAEIRVIRKRTNDQLDKMEKHLTDEVESKFDLNIVETNQDVDSITKMKSSVQNRKKVFQDAKNINEAELFVQLKIGNSTLGKNERILKRINTNDTPRSMQLFLSRDIRRLLENDDISLGRFSENLVVKSTKHVGDISIRLQADKFTCSVRDACCTANGHVIISDLNNKRIKKLDDSYAVIEHLDMPGSPFGLCEVDNTLLAVTLMKDKKVQYVSQTPLTLGNAFTVSDCCRGIDCYNGQLYVCCGGDREKGEGPGHIAVYDKNGMLLRSYYEGQKWPLYTKIIDDENIFISDYFKTNLLALSMTSHILSEMHIQKLTEPLGSCRIGDGQLCIAGWNSDNIVLVSESGECQQEILTSTDAIVGPRVVCFDERLSRLFVFLDDSDTIKIFTLIFD